MRQSEKKGKNYSVLIHREEKEREEGEGEHCRGWRSYQEGDGGREGGGEEMGVIFIEVLVGETICKDLDLTRQSQRLQLSSTCQRSYFCATQRKTFFSQE